VDGAPTVVRSPALVETRASESEVIGLARKSRLAEILFGQVVMSTPGTQTLYPTPVAPIVDHSTLLNPAEKRLVVEWIDTGGKYYNDPFNGSSGVRVINTLSLASFKATVYPIIQSTCAAGCHVPRGSNTTAPPGTSFLENKFVLTGDAQSDFNNTLTMISDLCQPDTSYLLSKPSTAPHPMGAVIPGTNTPAPAVLPIGSANYNAIRTWISSGC
jgi:hypothetical protein